MIIKEKDGTMKEEVFFQILQLNGINLLKDE
jgi:hypothetical protein